MNPRDSGRTTVILAVGTTIASSIPVFLIGSLFVQMQGDIVIPAWVLGFAVAMYWAVAAVVSMLSGRIIGVIGSRAATLASLIGAAVSLLGSAIVAPGWGWLVVWAMVGGAANGIGHPASNHLMSVRVRGSRLATAFGIKQSAVPFAAFIAGLTVPALALTLGWRWGFAAAALVVVVLIVAFLRVGPRRVPRGTPRSRVHVPLSTPLLRYLLLLSSVTTLGAGAAGAVSAFAVTAGIERGIPDAAAGVLLSVGSLIGAAIRTIAGRLADRYGGEIALPLAATLLGSGTVGVLFLSIDSEWSFVVGILLALGPGWGWTGLTHFVVSRTAGAATPTATGIVQTGSYIGSGAGPLLFGLAYTATAGTDLSSVVWVPVAVASALATVIALVLTRVTPPAPV